MSVNYVTSTTGFKMAAPCGSLRTSPAKAWAVIRAICFEAERFDPEAWDKAYAIGGSAIAAHINSHPVLRGPGGNLGAGPDITSNMDGSKVLWKGYYTPGRWLSVSFPSRHEAIIAWETGTGDPSCFIGGLLKELL